MLHDGFRYDVGYPGVEGFRQDVVGIEFII